MDSIIAFLEKWNKSNDTLAKMQGAYLALAVVTFLVAAIVSLVNYRFGQSVLFLAFVFGMVFALNGIVYALLRTFVTSKLDEKAAKKPRKK